MFFDRKTLIGAGWTLLSAVAFLLANLAIRHLSARLPPLEMALFRSAGGVLLSAVAWRALVRLRRLPDPAWHAARAVVGAASLVALVHAYSALPVALVAAVMYARVPLVIPLQRLILGERASPGVWLAVALGIGGALLALWPRLAQIGTPHWNWGVASLLVAVIAGAGSHICMRRLAANNPPSLVVALSALLISAAVSVPASLVAVAPPAGDWPLLLAMALLSGFAQWATVHGYRYASPGDLMPITLVDVPLALAAGWLLFGELPTALSAIGGGLVIAAALAVVRARRP